MRRCRIYQALVIVGAVGLSHTWLYDCTFGFSRCGGSSTNKTTNVTSSSSNFSYNYTYTQVIQTSGDVDTSNVSSTTLQTVASSSVSVDVAKYIKEASNIQDINTALNIVNKLSSSELTTEEAASIVKTVFASTENMSKVSEQDTVTWVSFLDEAKSYLDAMESTDIKKYVGLSANVLLRSHTEENSSTTRSSILNFEEHALAATVPLLKSGSEDATVEINMESANILACKSSALCKMKSEHVEFNVRGVDSSYITYIEYTRTSNVNSQDGSSFVASRLVSVAAQTENKAAISMPTEFALKHTEDLRTYKPACAFIDLTLKWSQRGCKVVSSNTTHTSCSCNHTTNFAVLMLHTDVELSAEDNAWFSVLTYVGCGVSIAALIATMTIFIVLGLHKSERVILLWHLCFCLCCAQLILVTGTTAKVGSPECRMIAILLHFFFTAAFSWMFMEGIHLYLKATNNRSGRHRFKIIIAAGWVLPASIVAATVASGFNEYGTGQACWLSMENGFIWAFIGPAVGIIAINSVVLVFVIKVFLGLKSVSKTAERERIKKATKAVILLMPLLGITWIFGLLAFDVTTKWFLYLFCICNSLQGLAIFVLQCVRNDDVRKAFFKKYRRSFVSIGSYSSGLSNSSSTQKTRQTCVNSELPTGGLPTIAKW